MAVALAGGAVLAGAMGIGRFMLTPAIPMMIDGTGLTAGTAGILASANFAGYLAGALLAMVPWFTRRAAGVALSALVASAALVFAMTIGVPLVWLIDRALAGVASALALVLMTAHVSSVLAAAGREDLLAVHFSGVGLGIAATAILAAPPFVGPLGWRELWGLGGVVTVVLFAAALWGVSRGAGAPADHGARATPPGPQRTAGRDRVGLARLVLSYLGLGFGYVITATFLVAMLREGPGGRWAEVWIWLLVGLAAAPSVWAWHRIAAKRGPMRAYRLAFVVAALGVGLSAMTAHPAALIVTALALGGTFMGLTALGLGEARRRTGGAGWALGLMTAAFGLGQMAGPVVAGVMRELSGSYAGPSALAAFALAIAAVLAPVTGQDRA